MKILTVLGARPQFIKAAPCSKALASRGITEILVHTGQHFDQNMSEVFFDELNIPRPTHQLSIHGGGHGEMTGRMLIEIERLILAEKPDRVMVYGDTNSTLAGALAAAKLNVPVVHVEAGLRSFNMRMPEEVNRILTDQISEILFCPTEVAVKNLMDEGFARRTVDVLQVGDVMQDAALMFASRAKRVDGNVPEAGFILATIHRAENTDDPERLSAIVGALNVLHKEVAPVVLPVHPRTRQAILRAGLQLDVVSLDPVGYLEMLDLLGRTALVLTDSGGLQKEAYFFGKSCVTMRDQTEWVELIHADANILTGADTDRIVSAARSRLGVSVSDEARLYGGGEASSRIAERLAKG